MTSLDYYKILQLSHEATPQKINKAFSNLRILFDENKEKNAKEIMQLIDEAYFVLRDPLRRAAYDIGRLSLPNGQPSELSEVEKIIASWGLAYFTEGQLYIEKIHSLNHNVKILVAIGAIIFLWAVVQFRWDIALGLLFFIAFIRKILGAIYLVKNPPPPPEVWGVK